MIEVQVPLSKSISNRLLIIALLSKQELSSTELSQAQDTLILKKLIDQYKEGALDLNVEDCGTAFRFLCAFLATQNKTFNLFGTKRLNQRPITPLIEALREMGAKITYPQTPLKAPLQISGPLLSNTCHIDCAQSSQFLSALLLIGAFQKKPFTIYYKNLHASKPYAEMTIKLLRKAGASIDFLENRSIINSLSNNKKLSVEVEKCWSSISYFYNWAMHTNKPIFVSGVKEQSIQGDAICVNYYKKLGVDSNFTKKGLVITSKHRQINKKLDFDFSHCPDIYLSVLTGCIIKQQLCSMTGLENLNFKESERLTASLELLDTLGIHCTSNKESLTIECYPENYPKKISIKSLNDHRIIMSFKCLSPIIKIDFNNDSHVVKSFKNYHQEVKKICQHIEC